MPRIVAVGAMLAILLALGAVPANAKHGGGSQGGICPEDKFQHCLSKCKDRGGRKKTNFNAQKCAKHCYKKC
jgi:hypothetical protein